MTKSARKAAQDIISNHNILKLNAEDSRAFADAILNPQITNRSTQEGNETTLAGIGECLFASRNRFEAN